jgi:hypothetical protein
MPYPHPISEPNSALALPGKTVKPQRDGRSLSSPQNSDEKENLRRGSAPWSTIA